MKTHHTPLQMYTNYFSLFKTLLFNRNHILKKVISGLRGKGRDLQTAIVSLTCQASLQFSSVAQLCPTLWDPMNRSTPGLPVHHKLPEFTQTHAHRVSDAIQPFHPLLALSPPARNPSQHQGLFEWINSWHEVANALEFQLRHQSFPWTPRTDLL